MLKPQKKFCEECGLKLIKCIEPAEKFEMDMGGFVFLYAPSNPKYCKKTGKKLWMKSMKCPRAWRNGNPFSMKQHTHFGFGEPFTS